MTFENHANSWEQSMGYFTFTTVVWRYFVSKCRNGTQALEHNGIAPLYQQFWSQFLHRSRRLILPDSSFIAAWEMLCQGFL